MTPERWQRIKKLYHSALERDTDEQAIFLAEACDGDEAMRGEVESLLRCDTSADRFFESDALEVAAKLCAEDRVQSMIGRQIGPYQILSLLGAGGMGEVHLALDTRLGRKVAVKLLPSEFTTDAERLLRFEQEARAASALNHPNIITVHEIGEIEGRRFIVTEYVEGETLRQRIASAPQRRIRLSEALEIAAQVAAALQAAHDAGVTHRDIKPENVMLRADGLMKVLDFGLAKLSGSRAGLQAEAAESLDIRSGVVMGTVSYMSPEQARGENVDHRTDIFSLGVMLYEMLAGRRPFEGATASDVMAAALMSEPVSLMEVVPEVPAPLWRIVQRCLEKRPGQRFQSAGDLGFALGELSASSGAKPDSELGAQAVAENVGVWFVLKRERMAWLATVAALLLGTLGFAWAYLTRQPMTNDARAIWSSIMPPEGSSFDKIAVSPDGRHLAFIAGPRGNVWVRQFDSGGVRQLAGTQDAKQLFWSPDSRFIGFFAEGQLKKIEITGGPVQPLYEATQPRGGAWNRDGLILFGSHGLRGLLQISARGGEVTQVTTLDVSRQEITHAFPTFLSDGRHFLYSIQSGRKETRGVYLGSLDRTLKRRLLDDVTPVKYMAAVPGATSGAGWLVFGRAGALLARPFDTGRLDFIGEPLQLSDKVRSDFEFLPNFSFSVSDNGVLVFDPSLDRRRRQYRWVDRRGQPINSMTVEAGPSGPWLSPDEKRFLADRIDPRTGTSDLWLCDILGGNADRFTFDQAGDFNPIWAPNGHIVWASDRDVITNLYQKAASGAGEETLLWRSDSPKAPTDWSRDGRFIIYRQTDPKTKEDIWVLPMAGSGEREPVPLIRTEANETAGTLSPDGRWLAYTSNASGQYEIYVQRFPDGGGKQQVSNGGGIGPRWRRDGRELFYYARNGGSGKLMAARVRSGESFKVDAAVPLFEFIRGTRMDPFAPYAVTGAGQRFLINELVETKPNAPLTVVFNWTAGLRR
jgi:Tol biopolymer transport system component